MSEQFFPYPYPLGPRPYFIEIIRLVLAWMKALCRGSVLWKEVVQTNKGQVKDCNSSRSESLEDRTADPEYRYLTLRCVLKNE